MSYNDAIINSITVRKLLNSLDAEDRSIIEMWMSDSYTLQEIGNKVGMKFHGKKIKASVIRYRRNKILKDLKEEFEFP